MKNILLICLILITSSKAFTQDQSKSNSPLTVSYFGHFGLHPGIKIGKEFSLKQWEKQKKKRKASKLKQYLISPQIGFYTHSGNHSGLIFQTEFSKRTEKKDKRFYSAWGAGLGYMLQINPANTYVFNENGELTEKNWSSRSYFMPSLNIETGLKLNSTVTLYDKITVGSRMKCNTGFTLEPFFELGLKINLKTIKDV